MSEYRKVFGKSDISHRISSLFSTEEFSIGILDFGDKEDLESTLMWYSENVPYSIFVLTTEYKAESYDKIQDEFPKVTFIIFKADTSTGEYVNVMANECMTEYFLITRTDMDLVSFQSGSLLSVMSNEKHPLMFSPLFLSSSLDIIPSLRVPFIRGKEIDPQPEEREVNDDSVKNTLYSPLCVGLYNRAIFQRLRGFDIEIESEYYMALDFGVRGWLFGYPTLSSPFLAFRMKKSSSIIEDKSECEGMKKFYTRTLSIKRMGSKNIISKWKPYVDKKVLKEEVKKKQLALQKMDFFTLVNSWEKL